MGAGPHYSSPPPHDPSPGRLRTPSKEPLIGQHPRSTLQASTSGRMNPLFQAAPGWRSPTAGTLPASSTVQVHTHALGSVAIAAGQDMPLKR